ncbi:aldo/keto reductase [Pseudolysinimonas sp.]|uniref:aldo/keto reductase n=1 Tax=Pseudolysinimonas sp. TaxID=2680009 RepID=UPI003F7E1F20
MTETAHTVSVRTPLSVPTTAQTATIVDPVPAERRPLGLEGRRVLPVGLSGRPFGWTLDAAGSDAVLDAFLAAGGDLIDTADAYAGGRSEIILGNWMRSRRARDRMVVATKVGTGADHPGVGARAITAAVHDSLRRLRTDRLDLLVLHVDDPETDFEETLLAVDELIRAGSVLGFGVAAHPGMRLIEARIACAQLGVAPMLAVQPVYNLLHRRDWEQGIAPIAAAQRLAVMPRYSLAGGVLAGSAPAARRRLLGRGSARAEHEVLSAVDQIATEADATMAAVAMAWLLSRPDVVAPVASASTTDEVIDLVSATRLRLTRRQLGMLDRASQPFA